MKKILKFYKEKKTYIITTIITLVVLGIIYTIKNIFPFGVNYAVFSSIHEEITAMYYHLWDSIRGSSSLLIDFSSGGGINFFATIGYYLSSPISLLILLVPKIYVVYFTSVIIGIKILLASTACLYMFNKLLKKLPDTYKILLSCTYALLSYTLILYINSSWLDSIYLLPLLIVGLKKLLDLKSSRMYIIVLSLSLICSLSISTLATIYILILAPIYLNFYKEKKDRKEIFKKLLISTIISILISSFILIPTYSQVFSSINFNTTIASSLIDKLFILIPLGIGVGMYLLYLFDKTVKKIDKRFINILLCLFIIPILFNPISKILSLGINIELPIHYGLLILLTLFIVAGKYLMTIKKEESTKKNIIISTIVTIISSGALIVLLELYSSDIINNLINLSLNSNKAIITCISIFIITLISVFVIFKLNKNNKYSFYLFTIIAIMSVFTVSKIYIGGNNQKIETDYKTMFALSEVKGQNDNYYVKNVVSKDRISNGGMVSTFNSLSAYNHLINNDTKNIMKRLGYDGNDNYSYSSAGNLFFDTLLAQRYSLNEVKNNIYSTYYRSIGTYNNDLYMYRMRNEISYGYLLDEIPNTKDAKSSFELGNIIYESITQDTEIFEYNNKFKAVNIEQNELDDSKTELKREGDKAYLEKNVLVMDTKAVYLEINYNSNIPIEEYYDAFSVKLAGRDTVVDYTFPNDSHNGLIYLGTYTNELIQVEVHVLKDVIVESINVAYLDLAKYNDFVKNNKVDADIIFNRNKINIDIESEEEKILFLPINYYDSYKVTNNGSKEKVLKVYDNYVGININEGENDITITYIPNGLITGCSLSLIGVVLFIIYTKNKKVNKQTQ